MGNKMAVDPFLWPVEAGPEAQLSPPSLPSLVPTIAHLSKPTPPTRKVALAREVDIITLCDAGCRLPGSMKCASCKATRYCSTECQRRSWKRHKPLCKKIKDLNVKLNEASKTLIEDYGDGTEDGFLQVWSLKLVFLLTLVQLLQQRIRDSQKCSFFLISGLYFQ